MLDGVIMGYTPSPRKISIQNISPHVPPMNKYLVCQRCRTKVTRHDVRLMQHESTPEFPLRCLHFHLMVHQMVAAHRACLPLCESPDTRFSPSPAWSTLWCSSWSPAESCYRHNRPLPPDTTILPCQGREHWCRWLLFPLIRQRVSVPLLSYLHGLLISLCRHVTCFDVKRLLLLGTFMLLLLFC